MLKSVLDQPETQSDALDTLFDFDRPKGSWRIQRPDGQYFKTWTRDDREWTPHADDAMPFVTEVGAQHVIDINQGSAAGRAAFRDCKPVNLTPLLDGDFIVCGCGMTHEADHCPTADGEGMAR